MKNVYLEFRSGVRYAVPHAKRDHSDPVDDIRLIVPFDKSDSYFLRVEFNGGMQRLFRAKMEVAERLNVEDEDILEIDFDI